MIRVLAALAILASVIVVVFGFLGPRQRVSTRHRKLRPAPQGTEPVAVQLESDPPGVPIEPAAPAAAPAKPETAAVDLSVYGSVPEDDHDGSKLGEPATVITKRFSPQAIRSLFVEERDGEDDSEPTGLSVFMLVIAVGQTDLGLRRKNNEDSYVIMPEQDVFVVADGMGGHAAGETASQLAVETMRKELANGAASASTRSHGAELVRSMEIASAAIFAAAEADASKAGMGTTIVAARFSRSRSRIHVAHIGDSRCYRLRGTTLTQLTTDHTLKSLGVGGLEGEKLTRAAGIGPTAEIDLCEDECLADDQYMLCSDGLTKMLTDDAISAVMEGSDDPELACKRLIESANARGGRDNTTVIVVRVIVSTSAALAMNAENRSE